MPTTPNIQTSQTDNQAPERQRASHTVRLLRAITLALILTTLGAWLGFC